MNQWQSRAWIRALGSLAVGVLAGCSNSDRLPTYALTGAITYEDGSPVEEGSMMFVAEGLPAGRGVIEAGRYTTGTYEATDGLVVGTFRVAITVSPPADFDPDAGGRSPLAPHPRYARPESSGIEVAITPDGDREYDLQLARDR